MVDQYKYQPIVPTDWPPPVGQDFFGRLALLQTQDRHATAQTILQKQWCMLRGQVDKIHQVTKDKKIDIQDVLKPCDSGQSLRVVVDGPPGIGKTTLCRKLLNMWANGKITHGQYNLVLYCPLRNYKLAQANELKQLLKYTYDCNEVTTVTEWLQKIHGEGLLIIFDGWDELSTNLRQSSLAARIIHREILAKCSVIVTSRSYASYSLLKISSVNRHIEVLGFSEEEIKAVIRGTLEKEPILAEKLVEDLEIRGDVQSLCYVPLVCSIVISVYRDSDGQLPITLTELYENFIIQTVRRLVEITRINNVELVQVYNLDDLPYVLDVPFKEICQFAYLSLKDNNPKMTFSSSQLHQSLGQSVNKGYLGLMTTFIVGIEERYQFLHLSIQEFLAAWWISKYEKTEEVFAEHFCNDHFRMCLRFVAGLTHLEHESYQQYFNNEIDLQCEKGPLFGFEKCYYSYFCQQRTDIDVHCDWLSPTNQIILLLQLLYESQNTKLCQTLSQSIKNHSLCFRRGNIRSSLFDILCVGYFLNNSNTTWNCLDLWWLNGQDIQVLSNTLKNNNSQCVKLEMILTLQHSNVPITCKYLMKLFNSLRLHNLRECYIYIEAPSQLLHSIAIILSCLIKLQQLKVLSFSIRLHWEYLIPEQYLIPELKILSELEENLYVNNTLCELELDISSEVNNHSSQYIITGGIVNSVIKGVTKNKSIQAFSLNWDNDFKPGQTMNDGEVLKTIELLLRNNHTLKALKLAIDDGFVLSCALDIVDVNTPLTALEIGYQYSDQVASCPPENIKKLDCLILHQLVHQPYSLPLLFDSHPNLQQLQLSLDTSESVIELLTIVQNNTTLKALKVKIVGSDIYDSMGPSLQDMLTLNQTIEYFEIDTSALQDCIPSTHLLFLTTGLSHNSSLQELRVPIPLSGTNYEQLTTFFNVISHKNNTTELKVQFLLDYSCVTNDCSDEVKEEKMTKLFYEQGLPLITNMLKLHTTMRILGILCKNVRKESQHNWTELSQNFWQTIFHHPFFQYIAVNISGGGTDSMLTDLYHTLKSQEKTLIATHTQQQPLRPLPLIGWGHTM